MKVTVDVVITDEDIRDMPIASGNAYWAQIFNVTVEGEEVYHVFEMDDYGEIDDQAYNTVTYDDIREAFGRIFANEDTNGQPYSIADYILKYFRNAVADGEGNGIDAGWMDTDATDVLLQVAIWDEVIYG